MGKDNADSPAWGNILLSLSPIATVIPNTKSTKEMYNTCFNLCLPNQLSSYSFCPNSCFRSEGKKKRGRDWKNPLPLPRPYHECRRDRTPIALSSVLLWPVSCLRFSCSRTTTWKSTVAPITKSTSVNPNFEHQKLYHSRHILVSKIFSFI